MNISYVRSQLRKLINHFTYPIARPGSPSWLIGTELKYGGLTENVPRNKVSQYDPRTEEQVSQGGMIGGDRMLHHGYAKKYSQYLKDFVKKRHVITLAEFGILKGTGLAIWCELFPTSRIVGFDIDLGHINKNMDHLIKMGAFKNARPELYEFDQFLDNREYLGSVLKGSKIDVCIDDGFHSIETIINTINSVIPFLSEHFVYFVEDNNEVHKEIRSRYPNFTIDNSGEFTVITNRVTE